MASSSTSNGSDIASLHKALRCGDLDMAKELIIESDSPLLWQANSINWTAMHVAASHGVEDSWLLTRALQDCSGSHGNLFVTKKTHNGCHSCISLFFRRHVYPLPWHDAHVKQDADRLREGLLTVSNNPALLDECRRRLRVRGMTTEDRPTAMIDNDQDADDAPLFRVERFWKRMDQWLRAAYLGTLSPNISSYSILHALAHVGGCPEQVARLAVSLYPEQTRSLDATGNLPLHVLCASRQSTSECEHLLKVLLEIYPEATECTNQQGRHALTIALAHGKHGTTVEALVEAGPLVLYGTLDRVSRLPSFALAATCEISITDAWMRRESVSRNYVGSLLHFLPSHVQEKHLREARQELELVKLNTIYHILRTMPTAIQCGVHSP